MLAQISSDLGVTLKQNRMAEALLGCQTQHGGLARSIVYRWFTDPSERTLHPPEDHPLHSRIFAATLRAVHGRHGDDPEADALGAARRDEPLGHEQALRHRDPAVLILVGGY